MYSECLAEVVYKPVVHTGYVAYLVSERECSFMAPKILLISVVMSRVYMTRSHLVSVC